MVQKFGNPKIIGANITSNEKIFCNFKLENKQQKIHSNHWEMYFQRSVCGNFLISSI